MNLFEKLKLVKNPKNEVLKIALGKYQYPRTFREAIKKGIEQGKNKLKSSKLKYYGSN